MTCIVYIIEAIIANRVCVLTPAPAVEVGEYSEQEGGRDGDGVAALPQHLLISSHHLHKYNITLCMYTMLNQ